MNAPAPGIYYGVPFEDYLRWPLLSQTTLKAGRRSMKHLRHALDEKIEPTDDMTLGSALHTAFLEPELMLDRIAVWRDRRAGKAWDDFCAENESRIILTANQHDRLQGMVRSLRAHPEVRRWLGRIEGVEVAAVGEVEGVMMKGRCDALTPEPLWDLKKVGSQWFDPRDFQRSAYRLGYHIQAYIYTRLFGRGRFVLGTVEDQPPHDVVVYELTTELMKVGEQEALALLQQYRHCCETGQWPGICDEIYGLDAPAWVAQQSEPITLDGEEIEL